MEVEEKSQFAALDNLADLTIDRMKQCISTVALLNNLAPACRAVPGPLDDESLYGGPLCIYIITIYVNMFVSTDQTINTIS